MALHKMVADCSKITEIGIRAPVEIVYLTSDEETAELARWADEEAKQKAYVPPPTLQDQIDELRVIIKALQSKIGVV